MAEVPTGCFFLAEFGFVKTLRTGHLFVWKPEGQYGSMHTLSIHVLAV